MFTSMIYIFSGTRKFKKTIGSFEHFTRNSFAEETRLGYPNVVGRSSSLSEESEKGKPDQCSKFTFHLELYEGQIYKSFQSTDDSAL